ncbi:hypothetical protein DICVIV_09748 [Dictyocaulus viviparus]|uniref:Uncharacterized protein n=1 Tax=Dictyocaulus viviparus TaxID=29172 RepID=A0A0D8XKH5_DICVI|nr:hypothetical protein DICVIV_09748 [Dictyocaulus viviparus]
MNEFGTNINLILLRESGEEDEFTYVIGEVIVEPHQICGLLLSECGKLINPFNSTWSVPLPEGKPTPILKQPVVVFLLKAGKPTLRVLHLTDIHLDMMYTPGMETKCSEAQCCRPQQGHRISSNQYFRYLPNVPTYFSVGNHEGVPIDNFAPHFTPERFHMDWLYNTMADAWSDWLPKDQIETVKYMGCYMKKIYPGLRLISINNVLGGDAINFFLYVNQTDPDGTMTWLIRQLHDAELAGDRVHILSHIPGADSEALEGWAINYYRVINRFENVVVGQFFGHSHSEEFYITYEDPQSSSSRPTSVVYSAPSFTTYSEFFPAYRIYTIDGVYQGSSYQVVDFEEWYMNLTEANENPQNPQWKQLYSSVNEEYGLKSQSPAEWNKMIERMRTDDVLFDKYRKNYYRRSTFDGISDCDENCKRGWLCNARQMHHSKTLCRNLGPLVEKRRHNNYRLKSKAIHPSKEEVQKVLHQKMNSMKAKTLVEKRRHNNYRTEVESNSSEQRRSSKGSPSKNEFHES